jgi:hypothetical protein
LPRFYAVTPLRCDSPAFSVPIMPAGPSQERSSAFVVLDRLDRPAAIHPAARKEGSAKLPSTPYLVCAPGLRSLENAQEAENGFLVLCRSTASEESPLGLLGQLDR